MHFTQPNLETTQYISTNTVQNSTTEQLIVNKVIYSTQPNLENWKYTTTYRRYRRYTWEIIYKVHHHTQGILYQFNTPKNMIRIKWYT